VRNFSGSKGVYWDCIWNESFDKYVGNGVKDCFLTGTKEWHYLANSYSKAYERHEKSNLHGESIQILLDNGSTSIQNELQTQWSTPKTSLSHSHAQNFCDVICECDMT